MRFYSAKPHRTITTLFLVSFAFTSLFFFASHTSAAPNYQMNYQGKLTNASNVAVADGTYNMRFWLLTSSTVATTSAVWTESLTGTSKVQVTNGLFSVMLGSTTPLTSVDFNQTLYLGVEIGGTSTAAWDGEMSPRKILGTVPAAFEADRLDGLTSTQFVRADATTTISSSSPLTILSIVQNGVGDILNLFDGSTEVFSVIDGGNIGIGSTTPSRTLTVNGDIYGANITATGTATFANLLVTGSSTIGGGTGTTGLTVNGTATTTNLKITALTASRALFTGTDNLLTTSGVSQYLIDSLSDETGTGSLVFSTNPLLAGFRSNASSTIGGGTGATGLTISGTATTTDLKITSLTASRGIFTDANNLLTTTGVSQYLIDSMSDETGTGSLVFSTNPLLAGFRSNASSTIGGGTGATGLTIYGGATTTGNAYFASSVGIGSTSPSALLTIERLTPSTAPLFQITASTSGATATSTFFTITSAGLASSTYASSTGLTAQNGYFGTLNATNLLASGSSTIGGGTGTTGLTVNGTATTTNLKITALTASRALFTGADNLLTTSGVSQYLIDSLSDETGTGSLVFSTNPLLAGFRSNASSTIGGGTGATGLTIYGGATTTGNAYFASSLGVGTTSPSATFALLGSGTTPLFRFASSSGVALLSLDNRGVLVFGTSTSADIFINGGSQTGNPQQNGNNVAIGNGTMWYASTTDPAQYNIAIGVQALLGSSTVPMSGDHNVAIGTQALASNASGTSNTAIGSLTLLSNVTGYSNTAVGYSSLLYNVSGYQNTGLGMAALQANTQGYQNTALGYASQLNNTLGTNNTSGGWGSLALNTTGVESTAFGSQALFQTTGSYNTAQGFKSLYGNITGIGNTAMGWQALVANDSGFGNVGIGYGSLSGNTSGSSNTSLGIVAGITNTSGNANTFLGVGADVAGSGFSTSTAIGAKAIVGCSNCMVLGGTGINYQNVGIGTTTPSALLTIGTTTVTGARVAGIKQYFGFVNSVQDAVYYGNETYITNVPTATSTLIGGMIRIADTSVLGNTVRGFEAQAFRGTNTKGENTGLSGFGRTFGVRGSTSGDAGDTYIPAGVFAETTGTTQGSALKAYSGTITTEKLVSLFQDISNFTGTGLQMNFGNAGGTFAATSSTAKFLDLQVAGTSKFMIAANGSTTIGDGVVSASLRIPFGGICVDNDGSCVSTTTGQIRSVTSVLGNSDLAEMYFSNQSLHAGDIIALSGGLSIKRADEETEANIIGVVSTKPGLTLGFDDTSLIAGENAYPVGLKGRVPIKLSTENGPIKKGDRIALSSIPGVGMKATESSRVVGIALEDYDGTRAYTDGFLNQFGDDMYKEKMVATQTIDPRSQDGCSNGGGKALGEEECIARKVKQIKVATPKVDTTREDTLRAFAQESALETRSANGDVAYVGQALMFIELTNYQIAGETRVLSELASSTLLENGAEGETIWSRVKTLAQNFVDGVLTVTGIKADRVEVKDELCVDGVCVTADDLRAILEKAHQAPQSAPSPQNNTGGGGVSFDPGTSSPSPSTEGTTGGGTTEPVPQTSGDAPAPPGPSTESPPAPEPEPTPPEPGPSPEPPPPEPPPSQ